MASDPPAPWADELNMEGPIVSFSSVSKADKARLRTLLHATSSRRALRTAAQIDDSARGELATHVVCGLPRRTLKVLFALARGAWLVGPEWLEACGKAVAWLDAAPFELAAFPGARRARLGIPREGRLLRGLRVHVAGATNTPTDELAELLRALGAASIARLEGEAHLVVEGQLPDASASPADPWAPDAGAGISPAARISEVSLLASIEAHSLPTEVAQRVATPVRTRPPLEPRSGTAA
ncbi:hypothetical protein T492DRAFT_847252 [Pavlovales sp. CCMP2436]|nr:hypothetical protein T492DRAFT_847252 [Pavlovales sp. CCMP2436]